MKATMHVHYDEEGDLLEISVGKPIECYATEVEPGIFIRRDEKTHEVKSIGVLGFKKRGKSFKDIALQLPLQIRLSMV